MRNNFYPPVPKLMLLSMAIACYPNIASAQQVENSNITEALLACQVVENDADRLACYDREVRAFASAQDAGEIMVAEREDIDQARREVFGLSVTENPIFGDQNDEGVQSITAEITNVRQNRYGKWILTLDTGATWMQTEARGSRRGPRKGQTLEIKRGLLGAFIAETENGQAFKVKRIN